MNLRLLFGLFLFTVLSINAQVTSENSEQNKQEEFVEDARNYNKVFAFKTDAFRALIGELTLAGEARVTRNMSVEANVMYVYNGFLLPLGWTYDFKDEYKNVPTVGGGAAVRFYSPRTFGSKSDFFGFGYKYKKLIRESDEVLPEIDENSIQDVYHIFTLNWGRQFIKNDWVLAEILVGIGYSYCQSTRVSYDPFVNEYSKETFTPDFLDDGHVPLAINAGFRVGILPF